MPQKPMRPCHHPGCPNLVQSGYCEEHKKETRTYDRYRGTAAERGYDTRWRKARHRFLLEHPLCECEECKREGKVIPAEVVDHKIPHKGDPVLFWDTNNWQAMSKEHHDIKTAKEDGGFGNGRTS